MKKLFLLGCVLLFSLSLLEAGGKTEDTKKPVTIKHWVWLDNPNDPTYFNLAKTFNSQNPGIKVEVELVGASSFYDRLINEVAAGGGPDTSAFRNAWVAAFAKMGALEPLDGYLAKWDGLSNIIDEIWPYIKTGQKDPTYQMPWELVVLYLYYNKDHFNKAGIAPPKTMEEFLKACKALTKDTNGDGKIDQYGYALRGARGGARELGDLCLR